MKAARIPVAVVTGSRSEFGLLAGTLDRLAGSVIVAPRVIVAGMHLESTLGGTWKEVEAMFPVAAQVPMSPPHDSPSGMALAVAEGIRGFSAVLDREAPRLLLVLGDRIEPFAAALAAAYRGLPIAHIHGGDLSGNVVDDLHRDSISRMARLHLPATERSAARLRSMAVEGRIEVVGAPGLDAVLAIPPCPREEALAGLGIPPGGPVLVVVVHPVPRLSGPEGEAAGAEAEEVLSAALQFAEREGATVAAIYPNNDAGHRAVIKSIESHRGHPRLRIFPSLPRPAFVQLLRHSLAILGNSSSGIIESVSFGVAAVNVGARQAGRERNPNVLDSPPERGAIIRALETAGVDPKVRAALASRRNVYGDGGAAGRIAGAVERFLGQADPAFPARMERS